MVRNPDQRGSGYLPAVSLVLVLDVHLLVDQVRQAQAVPSDDDASPRNAPDTWWADRTYLAG